MKIVEEKAKEYVEVRVEKVPGGYLLNGTMFLAELELSPEDIAEDIGRAAKQLADQIDAEIATRIYDEITGGR